MIKKVFPGWYMAELDIYHNMEAERTQWCKDNIGFTDHDTWVFYRHNEMLPGHFAFKQEKWAIMFVLRWSS